jgi:hypothetical protein
MLRRKKEYVSKFTLIKVYNAIILSHFDYCSLVWDNCADYFDINTDMSLILLFVPLSERGDINFVAI